MAQPGVVHVGTSGWSYPHWDVVLYPPGTPAASRLEVYTRRFATAELNASFYRWPRDASFASWRRRLPEGFVLSVKAPRGLTHARRLYSPEVWTPRIMSAWHELGERRGVLLVQLRPDQERDDARLDYLLTQLPAWVRVAVELPIGIRIVSGRSCQFAASAQMRVPCLVRALCELERHPRNERVVGSTSMRKMTLSV